MTELPWYVRILVGIGAWVTGIVAILLGGAILFLAFEFEQAYALSLLGAIYLAIGLALLRQSPDKLFVRQLGVAVAAAGVAMIPVGIAIESEQLWAGFMVSLLVTSIVIAVSTDKTLQFLASALTAVMLGTALLEEAIPYVLDIAALVSPVAVFLTVRPTKRDLQAMTTVVLLFYPVFAAIAPDAMPWRENVNAGGWAATAIHVILFLWLAYEHWKRSTNITSRVLPGFLCVAAVVVCLLLPPGGTSAMMIMMLAFVLGSRPLAVLGILLEVQFVVRYYYSLEMTLLDKSLLLMAVGAALLLTYYVLQRSSVAARAS